MALYTCNEHHHHHHFFYLDHITKLVHVNPIHHGGGHIVPVADFFVCCGSIRDLMKALNKVLKAYSKKG